MRPLAEIAAELAEVSERMVRLNAELAAHAAGKEREAESIRDYMRSRSEEAVSEKLRLGALSRRRGST